MDQAINWAKFSGVFCLCLLLNVFYFWDLSTHVLSDDVLNVIPSIPLRLLSVSRVPFLLHRLSLISIWLFHCWMIKPLSSLFNNCHTVAERVTINFLQRQNLSGSLNWDYISLSIFIWKCIFHKLVCVVLSWHTYLSSRCIWFPSVGPRSCQPQSRWDALDCDKLQQMTVERWRRAIVRHCRQTGLYHLIWELHLNVCKWLPFPYKAKPQSMNIFDQHVGIRGTILRLC